MGVKMDAFANQKPKSQFDLMRWKWQVSILIVILISIILYFKKHDTREVDCSVSRETLELRAFFPPPATASSKLTRLFSESKIQSYRNAKQRTDRYFLCTNTSISIKLRKGVIEIKLQERKSGHARTAFWSKYVLQEIAEKPTWRTVSDLLSDCSTFSWIPETNACDMWQVVDVTKKVQKSRIELSSLHPELLDSVQQCAKAILKQKVITVEYGLVEVIIYTMDGPKTIGRYNTVSLEDGPETEIDCLMSALEQEVEDEIIGAYPTFLTEVVQGYFKLHNQV